MLKDDSDGGRTLCEYLERGCQEERWRESLKRGRPDVPGLSGRKKCHRPSRTSPGSGINDTSRPPHYTFGAGEKYM